MTESVIEDNGPKADSCERGNESSYSIKGKEVLCR
jgi:hypothetical protein